MASEEWTAFMADEPLDLDGKKLGLLKSGRMRPLGLIRERQPRQRGEILTLAYYSLSDQSVVHVEVNVVQTKLRKVGDGWYEFRWNGHDYVIQRQL